MNNNNNIVESYRKAKREKLNQTHVIKKFHGKTDRYATCTVYTDGSAKGCDKARDQKSFAGWGIYFQNKLKNGAIKDGTKYGHLFNSSSVDAELRAVLEGLRFNYYPSHFEIVTDCSDIIDGLLNIHEKVAEYHAATNSYPAENYAELRMWNQINDEIHKNDKIVSLNARWVRGHSLDAYGELPDPNDYPDPEERQLVQDCIGNLRADECAGRGAAKSVRGSLYYYVNVKEDERSRQRSIKTSRKNFFNSQFARDEAVRFLSQQSKDFLPQDLLESIFDKHTLEKLEMTRAEIDKGRNPGDVFREVLKSQQVIEFGQSTGAERFMARCRDKINENDQGGASIAG